MTRRYLSDAAKRRVLERFGHRCPGLPHLGRACGKPLLEPSDAVFDHIDQVALSEDNSEENFQPLCKGRGSCNDVKTNGPGGLVRITSAGSDANRRGKVRRILSVGLDPIAGAAARGVDELREVATLASCIDDVVGPLSKAGRALIEARVKEFPRWPSRQIPQRRNPWPPRGARPFRKPRGL